MWKKYLYSILIVLFLCYNSIAQVSYKNFIPKLKEVKVSSTTGNISAVKNKMWETTLTSTGNYSNPYKDVILYVHYTNSDSSITFDSHGFWDGGSIFKIRSYFPETGQWTWQTTSSNVNDTGLHNKSGTITVSDYDGTNKLYMHGEVKTSSNNKYLTYADGTPFFWLGGSAYGLPFAATYNEWKKYIDDRHSKNFNVVQVAPARAHGGVWVDPPYSYPSNWKGDVSFFAEDKWNPAYWQEFDRFVEYANSNEIVVVVVGLGEPVHDDTAIDEAILFTRNFSARMEGYHVILSPAFDIWNDYQYSTMDSLGVTLADSRHLISQHVGHSYLDAPLNEYAEYFRPKSYLDFSMNQTGHNGGDLKKVYQKSREWNINLFHKLPMKPVINTEAYYSSGQYSDQITNSERNGTDENARELGWLSILSGSLGYTYGAQSIWNYGEEVQPDLTIPLDSSLNFISSTQMRYMFDFFSSFSWWKLEPNHDAIIYDISVPEEKKMALAVSEDGKFGAAFIPDDNSIKINMNVFSNKVNATWFDPINNIYYNGEANVSNSGQHVFTTPTSGEWALLLAPPPVSLTLKVFLEGPYSNGKMITYLASSIPLSQPYNKPPWNYSGTETIGNNFITNKNIVDWVLLELRTGSSASQAKTVIARKAVLINENGYIVDPDDGTTNVKFQWVDPGNYFITVLHRNHLSVVSSQEVNLTN